MEHRNREFNCRGALVQWHWVFPFWMPQGELLLSSKPKCHWDNNYQQLLGLLECNY